MPRPQHHPDYRGFLERLRKARDEAGLRQVDVAAKLGQPQTYVSKCERGERRVDVIELARFARLYRKPLDYFLPSPSAKASEASKTTARRRSRSA